MILAATCRHADSLDSRPDMFAPEQGSAGNRNCPVGTGPLAVPPWYSPEHGCSRQLRIPRRRPQQEKTRKSGGWLLCSCDVPLNAGEVRSSTAGQTLLTHGPGSRVDRSTSRMVHSDSAPCLLWEPKGAASRMREYSGDELLTQVGRQMIRTGARRASLRGHDEFTGVAWKDNALVPADDVCRAVS
jgi:hypothetical protein